MVTFENYERRIDKINAVLKKYDIKDFDEVFEICNKNNLEIENLIKGIQPICFDDAVCAYALGCAIALKQKAKSNEHICDCIGEALQSFCVEGSVSENRQIGKGHGELAKRLLSNNTSCFCFIAGHESFAASEGALGIANNANNVRSTPLKVIILGLGKDAGYIIARINGFTYVNTKFDNKLNKLEIVEEIPFSNGNRSKVKVYGAHNVEEGVAIMKHEQVQVSITGNSTNPTRFQHPVAGTYKNWCTENNKEYFSVASGGGTGRTLHPDNLGAGPASYGLTDTMGRMHCSVQFAGSSSVPAHVEMMGFIGMGNNPIVGATISCVVAVSKITNKN